VNDQLGRHALKLEQAAIVVQVARMFIQEVVKRRLALLVQLDPVHVKGVDRIEIRGCDLLGLIIVEVELDWLEIGVVFEEDEPLAVHRADAPHEPHLVGKADGFGPLGKLGLHEAVEPAILRQALQFRPVADHEVRQRVSDTRGPGVVGHFVAAAVPEPLPHFDANWHARAERLSTCR
jgi:hypothetical protein